MPHILMTPQGRTDLVEIVLYVRRDNARAARRFLSTINDKLELLAEFPGLGRPREEPGRSVRSFPVGNYLLLYRRIDQASNSFGSCTAGATWVGSSAVRSGQVVPCEEFRCGF